MLVVTETFLELAKMQLELRKEDIPLIVIPHPLGGLRIDEVESRSQVVVEQVLERLVETS